MTEEMKLEEKKSLLKLPKEEQMAWALATGALVLNSCGLLIIMEGLTGNDWLTQTIMFCAAIATFALGGYFIHTYHRWLVRELVKDVAAHQHKA